MEINGQIEKENLVDYFKLILDKKNLTGSMKGVKLVKEENFGFSKKLFYEYQGREDYGNFVYIGKIKKKSFNKLVIKQIKERQKICGIYLMVPKYYVFKTGKEITFALQEEQVGRAKKSITKTLFFQCSKKISSFGE